MEKAGVLLTDLSKAFDCLVHDLFIAKLHGYSFDYMALKLIYSYQGSILGPDLFNINSNDLFLFLILDIANFADDNSPFSCNTTTTNVISDLQNEAHILLNWLRNNGQKANPEKFHLILSDPSEQHSVLVGNNSIQNSKCEKLLGIKIDNKLTFDEHISCICSKASL